MASSFVTSVHVPLDSSSQISFCAAAFHLSTSLSFMASSYDKVSLWLIDLQVLQRVDS